MDNHFEPDPESGDAFVIPLVERCPKLRAIFEALRHELHPPDFTDCDTESGQPRSTRSKSVLTSSESQSEPNKQPLTPFQHTIAPPTDAECGLPSAFSEALSNIPSNLLPLSRTLASPQIAAVIDGYNRSELSRSLAHAVNLRRASGRARAILVITSSENAVREWVAAMCQALDEVQIISYSRAKTKRQATLFRLGQSQYPGVVVAAERSLKDGIQELWEALRQNRIAKKWEIVVSEVTTDKNIEGECSPLRIIRDGTAEKGVIVARKGLSKKKACKLAGKIHGVDVEKGFWLKKEDIRNTAMEESRKVSADSSIQPPDPRRRSPRLCSSLSADQESTPPATGTRRSRQNKRDSGELRKENRRVANRSTSGKKQGSKSLTSSDILSGYDKSTTSVSEDGDENVSNETQEKIKTRARALRLFSSGSSSSSEEKYYTPPSHAPTPPSTDTTPKKFVTPRTSFSPKEPNREPEDRLSKLHKSRQDRVVRQTTSPIKPDKSQIIKKVAAKSTKSVTKKSFSSGSPSSPVRAADPTRKRSKRLDVHCGVSSDRRLSRKNSDMKEGTGRTAVMGAAKNRILDLDSFDDQLLMGKRSSGRKNPVRTAVETGVKKRGLQRSYDSSDDQPLVFKGCGRKERVEGKAVTLTAKNRILDFDSSNDQPLVDKQSNDRGKTERKTVKTTVKGRKPELIHDSSDDEPLLDKLSRKNKNRSGNGLTTKAKNKRIDFDSSDDQPLIGKHSTAKERTGLIAFKTASLNGRLELNSVSSDEQPLVIKPLVRKGKKEGKPQTEIVKNRLLDWDSTKDQPLVEKHSTVREGTGRNAVKSTVKNRGGVEPTYDSSDDPPLVRKRSCRGKRVEGNTRRTSAKNKRTGPDLPNDQSLVTKSKSVRQKSVRSERKGVSSPQSIKRKLPSQGSPYAQEAISPTSVRRKVPLNSSTNIAVGTEKSGGGKRRSVFDEFRSSTDARLMVPQTAIPRAKSFPAPVQVKREESLEPQGFIWTWGNPKYKRSAKRRKSLPAPSSSSDLPVRRALPKLVKKIQVTAPQAITPKRIPRLARARASPSDLHVGATPRHKSPVAYLPAQSRPIEPEVIVISSGTEDEATSPRKAVNKRRIFDRDEARIDSRNALRACSEINTSSWGKSPSPARSRQREKLANANQVGSLRRAIRDNDGAADARSDDLHNFIRGINRKRRVKDLSRMQVVRYNKLVTEAQRFETMGMRKEAISSYEKCVHIYDGDMDLINRYFALLTKEGWLQNGVPRKPAKSPIRKRSRRRRNSGRRGHASPSASRLEVIDLTSP